MPYVDRDQLGRIVSKYANAQYEGHEHLDDDDPELTAPIVLTPEETVDVIKNDIVVLEAQFYMTRGEREGWLALMVGTAAAQGVTEAQLYAANPFYKKLKDLNDQIVALRAQL